MASKKFLMQGINLKALLPKLHLVSINNPKVIEKEGKSGMTKKLS
jgi:hypothetical protein